MVVGVSEGYKKELEINGVGYRAAKEGSKLILTIGYSHPVEVPEIEGITIEVPAQNKIVIHGCDKQKVGQFAAEVREASSRAVQGQGASSMRMKSFAARSVRPAPRSKEVCRYD